MTTSKGSGGMETVSETRQRMSKPDPKHPPYQDIIEDAFRDRKHKMGFTRDAILKHLIKKYGVLDKKTVMLKVNVAIRNGIRSGNLQKLSGNGKSGTFRHVETKAKPSSKDSKCKYMYPSRKRERSSPKDTSLKKEKASVKDIKKTYDLRNRNQTATKKETESVKTREITDIKMRGDAAKKKVGKQLTTSPGRKATPINVSKTDTNDPQPTLSQGSKASTFDFSIADRTNPTSTLFEAPSPQTTSFTISTMDKTTIDQTSLDVSVSICGSVMDTTDPKATSSKLHLDTLDSPQPSMSEQMPASREWPFIGIRQKRKFLIELMPALYGGGMVVLSDGRTIVADEATMKLFSPDMNPLSCLTFTARTDFYGFVLNKKIHDIAIFSETIAIVLVYGMVHEIQFIDISTEALSVSRSVQVNENFNPRRMTACRGYIYFTSNDSSKPSLVTKIDTAGKVCWSVPSTKQGELYNPGFCIESFVMDNSVRVVVTGIGPEACISVLDGESGDMLFFRHGQNCMFGLTTDNFNNIYIVNSCGWVSVLTSDLSEERIILTTSIFKAKYNNALEHDLDWGAKRIAFDHKSNSLFVFGGPQVDRAVVQLYQFC